MRKVFLIVVATVLLVSGHAIAGDAAAGKAVSARCISCHGVAGISPIGIYPNLAGQKEQYLKKQINAFRSGKRVDPSMTAMVAGLTDSDAANLAAFYSSIK